jgi:hypothetical protein
MSSDLESQRQRGETLQDTARRLEIQKAAMTPSPEVKKPVVVAAIAPAPRLDRQLAAKRERIRGRLAARGRTRSSGFRILTERVRRERAPTGGKGEFEIYNEVSPHGVVRKRVKYNGRAFAGTFHSVAEAEGYIDRLKEFAERTAEGRRNRLMEADGQYFVDHAIAARLHPLFIRVTDTTKAPKRLGA